MKVFHIEITPMPAKRMTVRSKWVNEGAKRYNAWKGSFSLLCKAAGYHHLDESLSIEFGMPMPKSWSNTKRIAMLGQPHRQTPDLDNLVKAVKDGIAKEDNYVHTYTNIRKVWAETGYIKIFSCKS
jgi:Holliday junction resolvase RusA-like endonuclease